MKKAILFLSILVSAVAVWAFCIPSEGPKTVVFIGDSITDGGWGNSGGTAKPSDQRSQWDQNHIFGHGYMCFVAAQKLSEHPESGYQFHNRGISGNTLVDLEQRWEKDALALNPDVLSILIGTNDVDSYMNSDAQEGFCCEEWAARYQKLINQAKAQNPNISIVLCTPFVAYTGGMKKKEGFDTRERIVKECAQQVRQLAKKNDAILVPFDELIGSLLEGEPEGEGEYWIWDGIHPTMAAHWKMAQLWMEKTASIL